MCIRDSGYIECFLEVTGFGKYFRDFESFGATGKQKGENILAVMQRLGSKSAVYVGDIIKDQQAAAYAGIPFVFARYGFGPVSYTHLDVYKRQIWLSPAKHCCRSANILVISSMEGLP